MTPLPLLDPHTLRRLCRAREHLAAHTGEPVPLAAAARVACLSPFHFQRLFCRAFGESSSPPKEQFYGIEVTFRDAAGNWFSLTQPKPH